MRLVPVILALVLLAVALPSRADDVDPTRYIGMDLSTAVTALGLPQQMFTWRGSDEKRDNVVFFYQNSLYLFWFRDRVWQVRFDRRYAGTLFGLTFGMTRDVVTAASPRALLTSGDSLFFDIDNPSYPMRVRLAFTDGFLSDMYVYRSDF
jgi:hypothetical protein